MNEKYLEIESSQRQHHEVLEHNERMYAESIKADTMLFNQLRPTVCKEGNKWCVWFGKDFATCELVGFGKTIHEAILDFNGSFYRQII